MSKKKFNRLVLNMGCFLKLLKLDVYLLEKQTLIQKRKRKQKKKYLNLKVSRHDKISILSFNKTALKLISIK